MKRLFSILNAVPENIPTSEYRYFRLLNTVYVLGGLCHLFWLVLFLLLGVTELGLFNILSTSCFLLAIYLNRRRQYFSSIVLANLEVIAHQILAVFLIGAASGFHFFLALAAMLPFLLPRGRLTLKLSLLMGNMLGFMFIMYYLPNVPLVHNLDSFTLDILGVSNIAITFLFLGIFGMYFARGIAETEEDLKLEREKSDRLLHNILPVSIANRLKDDRTIIADGFESVSVLFADIVGFTKLSERLTPEELVQQLNEVFSEFDRLAEKHGLEKIKTIGDAYMVSSGLPDNNPQHATDIANFALDVRAYMERRLKESNEKLHIRIGIHSGPAVAGVIGLKKFAYDVWGDTVNTASRMESHGKAEQIHVSEDFYRSLCDEFYFEKLAPMDVKGKGLMQTYYLINN